MNNDATNSADPFLRVLISFFVYISRRELNGDCQGWGDRKMKRDWSRHAKLEFHGMNTSGDLMYILHGKLEI